MEFGFLAIRKLAKKMLRKRMDADEELARQLQDEELARQLELELLQLDIEELDPAVWPHASNTSSSISSNSKKPIPESIPFTEPEADLLRAFGINLTTQQLSTKECGICSDSRPLSLFMSTKGCRHEYCTDCCKQHAEVKIRGGSTQINCPHEKCHHNYDMEQCGSLLSPASFDILNTRLTEAAIPQALKVYCPFQDCSAFMENNVAMASLNGEPAAASSSSSDTFAECLSCHRGFCHACNVPWHAGRSCSEQRAHEMNTKLSGDQKLRDLAERERWQQCGDCHRMIELQRGCNHMTCLCGNQFCYVCGKKWIKKAATCKCPRWDESRIIATSSN